MSKLTYFYYDSIKHETYATEPVQDHKKQQTGFPSAVRNT